jgi:hypothetical protein
VSRYPFPQSAGASGGPPVRPSKNYRAPPYLRFSQQETERIINVAKHELAGSVYLVLCSLSTLAGKYAGHCLTSYPNLEAVLRPPKPEKGQWPKGPSRKRLRTCLAALETAGLIERDAAANQAQGQLRCVLTLRVGIRAPEISKGQLKGQPG